MANYHGTKGRAWTDQDVKRLRAFALDLECGRISQAQIAHALNRTISSVEGKLRLLRMGDKLGAIPAPGLARYEAPERVTGNERQHLTLIRDANGYGFAWWPPAVMERVYALEVSPPRRSEFWRAA